MILKSVLLERKIYFLGFCIFWLVIALLEFGQDYISAMLNDGSLIIAESLSYKLFWPLFIPLSIVLDYGISKADRSFSGIPYVIFVTILITLITIVHLFVFSLSLFGISNLIHETPWTLVYLLFEKLSTRLYIALSVYLSLAILFFLVRRRRFQKKTDQKIFPKTITVKNGKNSVIVDIADIKWIGSDGAYLDIHTAGRKHVVLDSLKNIIQKLPDNFKRIHKSTIVNIDGINKLRSRGNGDYDIIMNDGQVLRLSRNYTKQLKGKLL